MTEVVDGAPVGRGLAVTVDADAPAGLAGRGFTSLSDFLVHLQELADRGRVAPGAVFVVVVGAGTRAAHRRWAWVTERGVAMLTGPGGERPGELRASNVRDVWMAAWRDGGPYDAARAALRGLAPLDAGELGRALALLPGDQAELVAALVEQFAEALGPGPVTAGGALAGFLGRTAAMDGRGAAAPWMRAAGLRWEAAEELTGLERKRLARLIRETLDMDHTMGRS